MNALLEKRTEVMQTLLSMIEPTENERGCLSCHVLRDIKDKNRFSLLEEWEAREDSEKNIMETTFISKENSQVLTGADDLIQLIRRKVITGKNITI